VRNADGNPKWIIALIQDITKRKRAEEALRQSQEDFGRAQEVGQIGWWRLDTRRNVLTWSYENHRIFGIPQGTPLTYQTFLETVHPDDREFVDMKWNAGLRGEPYDIEHRLLVDGKVKWVREKAYLEFDDSASPLGGFGITQDITERKQAEQQIHRLNETLEQRVAERTAEVRQQADQLRALASQLSQAELRERKRLANILHDHIQQLIVAARMQVNWLKRDSDAERIHATAQGVDAILREALEASRSLTVDLSPPALHETGLTGGLNWLTARMLEKNRLTVNLRADNKAEPATEEVRFLLFECVRELLFNVVKHAEVSEAQVTLLRTSDAHIKLIVSDHGKGFDPNVIRKRRSGETTFGLFSIQERLAHIGGRMNVESIPGKGVKVTLWVPVGETAANPEEAAEKSGRRSASSAENQLINGHQFCRVLIVDDHKIVREGLSGLLQLESGIEVVGEAADGPQAIELARTLKPDVIIMDVNLGKMTGVEATRKILAESPKIKIIGLSMHINTQIAVAMREAGAIAYFTKGGPSGDLIAAIHACAPPQSPTPE
jgi:PAS domain S-box-containing protein